jgi:hypothetical protein
MRCNARAAVVQGFIALLLSSTPAGAATPAPETTATVDTLGRTSTVGTAHVLADVQPRTRRPLSPGTALGVGLGCSVAPILIAGRRDSPVSDRELAWVAAASVTVGPSIGVWSGGRGDLAKRGLILRGICIGGIALWGIFGQATDYSTPDGLLTLGRASMLVAAASWVYDLSITPSATARSPAPRAQPGLRPDGRVALSARF